MQRQVLNRAERESLMELASGERQLFPSRLAGANTRYGVSVDLGDGPLERALITRFYALTERLNAEHWRFELDPEWGQPLKVLRYDRGGTRPHGDWCYIKGDRAKLTGIILLNDNYRGGELVVQERRLPIMRPGDGVFFPGFAIHCVLPVTRGSRYVLGVWRDGPAWR